MKPLSTMPYPDPDAGPATEPLHAALQRILESAEFRQSGRLQRFLAFCAAETLAGRGGALREPVIGVAVFDRPPGYDSQAEPIVRVEARRLRSKLDAYYNGEGAGEPTRLLMPRGSYAIQFTQDPVDEQVVATAIAAPPPQATPPVWLRPLLLWAIVLFAAAGLAWYAWPLPSNPGGHLTPITADRGLTKDPHVSPDGRWLVYASDRDTSGNLALYLQELPNGPSRRLTNDSFDAIEPSVEPGGKWVAYHSLRPGGGIYVVSADGRAEPRQVAAQGSRPQVSPSGEWILFSSSDSRGDWGQIWAVASGGGEPMRLASQFADASWPLWSANGSEVLFYGTWVSGVPERERDFWTVPFPAGTPTKLGIVPAGTPAIRQLRASTIASWRDNAIYFCSRQDAHDIVWRQPVKDHRVE